MAWDQEGDQSVGVKQGDIYIVDAITLPQWIYSTYISLKAAPSWHQHQNFVPIPSVFTLTFKQEREGPTHSKQTGSTFS